MSYHQLCEKSASKERARVNDWLKFNHIYTQSTQRGFCALSWVWVNSAQFGLAQFTGWKSTFTNIKFQDHAHATEYQVNVSNQKVDVTIQQKRDIAKQVKYILTSHSLWPWKPSWFSFLTATTMPIPGLVAARECSSIHPLKTEPKPPSPKTLSGRKFLVDDFSSLKLKLFRLEDCKISPSLRGVRGIEVEETLLIVLRSFPLLLTFLEFTPTYRFYVSWKFSNIKVARPVK